MNATEPRSAGHVTARIKGSLHGVPLEIELTSEVKKLAAALEYLEIHHFKPEPKPLTWERTAEGIPICPRHRVPMRLREKQGDQWYSHNVGQEGSEMWCRGYPGPNSPGYDVEIGGPVAETQRGK